MKRVWMATAALALVPAAAPASALADRYRGSSSQLRNEAIDLTTAGERLTRAQWRWRVRCDQPISRTISVTTGYDASSPLALPVRLVDGRFATTATGPLDLDSPSYTATVRSSISGYVRDGVATGAFSQTVTVLAGDRVVGTCSTGRVPWVARRAPAGPSS